MDAGAWKLSKEKNKDTQDADLAAVTPLKAGRGSTFGSTGDTETGGSSLGSSWSGIVGSPTAVRFAATLGPGLFVCLADTDAPCLIVAMQSGARWAYSLLLLQFLLIPVLFLAQELTVRLGVFTNKGHAACIRERFGPGWAWFSTSLLMISCIGAIVSELGAIVAVAELWGLNLTAANLLSAALLVVVVIPFSYRQIEAIGVCLGLCELVFLVTPFLAKPKGDEMAAGLASFPLHEQGFMQIFSANIGAVLMPWMIYFQQSAIVARRLTSPEELVVERTQTLLGSILTQCIMIGALVTAAALHSGQNRDLKSAQDIHVMLVPLLGEVGSKVLLTIGFCGGSLCASLVVSLTAAWGFCEAGGWEHKHSLDSSFMEAPKFYMTFLAVISVGVAILEIGVNVVALSVYVELMDALLMPMAIGFLYVLATGEQLPEAVRVNGIHKVLLAILFSTVIAFALGSGIISIITPSDMHILKK